MLTPVPSLLPLEGSNIAEVAGDVKSLVRSPLVVAGRPSSAREEQLPIRSQHRIMG